MPNRKTKRAAKAGDLLPDELQARKIRARMEKLALRHAEKEMRAALANYNAADRGRRNRDWRASPGSADLMILPESATLNARAREAVRNTWMGASIARAAKRNVAGTGVDVVPLAKDADGNLLKNLNRRIKDDFWWWGSDKNHCDVERRQNFWQKQRLCVAERKTVGQAFVVWSYRAPLDASGRIDKRLPVGLRLQSFEAEQLDTTLQSYQGREVRNGIELDPETGAALAYHLFTRNPNDYLSRGQLDSVRVPRERVFHYFDQDRVLQTQGVTELAPVLQDLRDVGRYDGAELMKALMQACIGAFVTKNATTPNGYSPLGVARAAGDTGQTSSGMSQIDFVPGMVPHLQEGESVTPFTPTSPGGQYEPFVTAKTRGIAAGVGMSGSQLLRYSGDASFSSARQDLIEDWREYQQEQDNLASDIVIPVYLTWFNLAVLEGRFDDVAEFDADTFLANPRQYTAVKTVGPRRPWIDPEKEANAYVILLKNSLITREEIMAECGKQFADEIIKMAEESEQAAEAGVTLIEDAERKQIEADAEQKRADAKAKLQPPPEVTPAGPDPELERIKAEADAYGVGVRAGVVTPQAADEEAFRQKLTLPPMSEEVKQAWDTDKGVRRPITLTPSPGQAKGAPGGFAAADPNADGGDDTGDTGDDASLAARLAVLKSAVPAEVPNYRASTDESIRCATCRFFVDGRCQAYDFAAAPDSVCAAYETIPASAGRGSFEPPPLQDGQPSIDNTAAGGFAPDARNA